LRDSILRSLMGAAMEFLATVEQRMDMEAARTSPPRGFPALPEIPAGRYTRPDFFALEVEHVWRKTWICIGRQDDIGAEPGSYRTFKKLGSPMLIVRGRDGVLRAFYNTCRHRGAPVVRDEAGRTGPLRCQFHSWTYGLDGRLIGVPDEHDFACLDTAKRGLLPIRLEIWGGLLFINETPEAEPLLDFLGPLVREVACAGMESLRTVHRQTFTIECNWKAAIDAFLEIYHLETLHPGARGMIDCPANAIELLPNGHSVQVMRKHLRPGGNWNTLDGAPDILALPHVYRRNTVSYSIFPNIIMPVEAIGVPLLIFYPLGHRRCEMHAIFLGPDWGDAPRPAFWDNFLESYCKVLLEDQVNLAPIQDSLDCGAFSGMLINYQERRIYWLHEEIDRLIGADRLPRELAMSQLLTPYVQEPLESIRERTEAEFAEG
jgi:phenylpropionate dioxygenase-like ring-hydroxylating dioxygenase large terminal subunit